jgi:hypothetical protein
MKRRLVVIAGPPLGGPPPVLTPQDEERVPLLMEACYRDTLTLCESLDFGRADPPPQLILVYPNDPSWYAHRTSNYWLQLPRMGEGLAQCLDNSLIVLGPDRSDQTVFLTCYTPHLPLKTLREAFLALGQRDTVLGPSEHGGIHLLGVRGKWPTGILGKVRWDSDQAEGDVRKTLRRARISCALLPTFWDLYSPEGITRLAQTLSFFPDRDLRYLRRACEDLGLT